MRWHGISRLPEDEDTSSKRKTFKDTLISYVHIHSAQLRSAEGKVHIFLATRPRVQVRLCRVPRHRRNGHRRPIRAWRVATFPYQIHTVPTDNGVEVTDTPTQNAALMPDLAVVSQCVR